MMKENSMNEAMLQMANALRETVPFQMQSGTGRPFEKGG